MRLNLERLEGRELPASTLTAGVLAVDLAGAGDRRVSVDAVGDQVRVTEDGRASLFDAAAVQRLVVRGSQSARNVVQNNTALPCVLVGGPLGDTLFGGLGRNWILPGGGADVVYALLGTNDVRASSGAAADRVFTNASAAVQSDANDLVARFFADGRTPGSGRAELADGVLYLAPPNGGSDTRLNPLAGGRVLLTTDWAGVQTLSGDKAVAYFGGGGSDRYLNNTTLDEAAYGSAGNDVLVGGRGAFSLMKGSSGDDTLIGRSQAGDWSGNGGADVLVALMRGRRDVLRVDAADVVLGAGREDVFISP